MTKQDKLMLPVNPHEGVTVKVDCWLAAGETLTVPLLVSEML